MGFEYPKGDLIKCEIEELIQEVSSKDRELLLEAYSFGDKQIAVYPNCTASQIVDIIGIILRDNPELRPHVLKVLDKMGGC